MPTSKWFTALAVAGVIAASACAPDADTDDGMTDDIDAPGEVVDTAVPPPPTGGMAPRVDASMLPEGVTQEMIDAGQQIFVQAGFCFTCHGEGASGSQLAPDLTDGTWINVEAGDYEEIVQLVTSGVPEPVEFEAPMPPRGGAQLTDEQVRQVAAYVWSLSHGG